MSSSGWYLDDAIDDALAIVAGTETEEWKTQFDAEFAAKRARYMSRWKTP